jgi:hypothetical protein
MQFLYMEVSENVSFPKSSKFSIENHGFGDPLVLEPLFLMISENRKTFQAGI